MIGNSKDKEMAKSNEFDTNSVTMISTGTIVKGDITSEGDFRIVGKLTGSIRSKGKVVVGPSGMVEGDIFCQNADFAGTVKGNVDVENLLFLKNTVVLTGNIKIGKLSIEAGAQFSGNCSMTNAVSKTLNEAGQTKKGA